MSRFNRTRTPSRPKTWASSSQVMSCFWSVLIIAGLFHSCLSAPIFDGNSSHRSTKTPAETQIPADSDASSGLDNANLGSAQGTTTVSSLSTDDLDTLLTTHSAFLDEAVANLTKSVDLSNLTDPAGDDHQVNLTTAGPEKVSDSGNQTQIVIPRVNLTGLHHDLRSNGRLIDANGQLISGVDTRVDTLVTAVTQTSADVSALSASYKVQHDQIRALIDHTIKSSAHLLQALRDSEANSTAAENLELPIPDQSPWVPVINPVSLFGFIFFCILLLTGAYCLGSRRLRGSKKETRAAQVEHGVLDRLVATHDQHSYEKLRMLDSARSEIERLHEEKRQLDAALTAGQTTRANLETQETFRLDELSLARGVAKTQKRRLEAKLAEILVLEERISFLLSDNAALQRSVTPPGLRD